MYSTLPTHSLLPFQPTTLKSPMMLSASFSRSLPLHRRPTALAALAAVESVVACSRSSPLGNSPSSAASQPVGNGFISFRLGALSSARSRFHTQAGRLSYKASTISPAEFAVAVDHYDYDEDRVGGGKVAGSSSTSSSPEEEGLDISKLGISQEIVSALAKKGITSLFPIQRAVLVPAMEGKDLFGRARTGTGKTLAFGIPIIDKIIKYNAKHGKGRNPLALVMAPTRELAKQVEKEFHESAPSLDTICLYGGTPIQRQMRELDYGIDVCVGTPGRIIDLMKRGSLNLSEVQFVVLDEADQMLNVGFVDDIETIFQKLPPKRQNMLFSATMPSWIKNLVRNYLKSPLTIDLVGDSDKKLADGITLYCIASESYQKAGVLGPLITEHAKGGKSIVFTETKRDADRLAYAMAKTHKCEALHGDITQGQRERTLKGFRDGKFSILVATDVAARGLDVPNVDLVIHYAIPNSPETFVHRSGRTGRAGKKGTAILIYGQSQSRQIRAIERDIGSKFTELPKIAVEGGNIMSDMDSSSRFGSFGSSGGRGGSSGGYGRFGGGSSSYGSGRSGGGSSSYGSGRSGGGSSSYGSGRNGGGSSSYGSGGSGGGSSSYGSGRGGDGLSSYGSGRSGGGSSSYRSGRGGSSSYGSGRGGYGSSSSGSGRSGGSYGGSSSGRSERGGSYRNFGSGRSSGFEDSVFGSKRASGSQGGRGLFEDFEDDIFGSSKRGNGSQRGGGQFGDYEDDSD